MQMYAIIADIAVCGSYLFDTFLDPHSPPIQRHHPFWQACPTCGKSLVVRWTGRRWAVECIFMVLLHDRRFVFRMIQQTTEIKKSYGLCNKYSKWVVLEKRSGS